MGSGLKKTRDTGNSRPQVFPVFIPSLAFPLHLPPVKSYNYACTSTRTSTSIGIAWCSVCACMHICLAKAGYGVHSILSLNWWYGLLKFHCIGIQ